MQVRGEKIERQPDRVGVDRIAVDIIGIATIGSQNQPSDRGAAVKEYEMTGAREKLQRRMRNCLREHFGIGA